MKVSLWIYGLAAVIALSFVILIITLRSPRLPFENIRWEKGYPVVFLDDTWGRLLSVNEVACDLLIDRAIKSWGTSYQDRFSAEFNSIMRQANGRDNIVCAVEFNTNHGPRVEYALSTSWKYKRLIEHIESERYGTRSDITHKRPNREKYLLPHQVAQDVRYLEWTLRNRYAYLEKVSGATLRKGLDELNNTDHAISRMDFALQLQRILAGFNDSHTRISLEGNGLISEDNLVPCKFIAVQGRIVCLVWNDTSFLKPGFPYLKAINDVPVDQLLDAIGKLLPHDKEPLSSDALDLLQRTDLMMTLAGKPFTGYAELLLHSIQGDTAEIVLTCSSPRTIDDFRVPVESHVFKGGIGYLGLRTGMYPGREFKIDISNAMIGLKDTKGLILDLRDNPGGRRDAIPLLMNYFVAPKDLPQVVNVAFARLNSAERPPASMEILRSRGLWSANKFSDRASIRKLLNNFVGHFTASMELRNEMFSSGHFMVITNESESGAYYYSKQVIVLHDGETASAAGVLLGFLKGRRGVTLMGSASDADSGFAQMYRLPNSGLTYWLSSMASFKPDGTLLDATSPDVDFKLSYEDMNRQLSNPSYDPMIEAAVELLKQQRGHGKTDQGSR